MKIEERTTITLSISSEDKKKLKLFALQNDTTASAMLHYWIINLPSSLIEKDKKNGR